MAGLRFMFTVREALTDSENGAFRLVTHLPGCTRLRPRMNDYGVLGSTGGHNSKKGRPGGPDKQRVSWTWVPLLGCGPSPG